MKRTRKKKWLKVARTERFNLFRSIMHPQVYEVSWKNGGKYLRRRYQAPNVDVALEQAPVVCGFVSVCQKRDFTLSDAFHLALERSNRGDRAKEDWAYAVRRFLSWLARHHSSCTHWHLLTRSIIDEYLSSYRGKSDTAKRLALQPIRQTAKFMADCYEYRDVAAGLKLGSKLKTPPAVVYLADVAAFLDYLAVANPRLEAGAALQGLAGLQLQEALRLTWDKVDLQNRLIEISGVVKNPYRNRVIPICRKLIGILRKAHNDRFKQKVIPIREHAVLSPTGCSYVEGNSFRNYSLRLSRIFREWNEEVAWAPKDLRNCILTYAVTEGIHGEVWEQYVGHSPRTITARHYVPRLAAATIGERGALEKQMRSFKLHVVEPLDFAIGNIESENSVDVLTFFEHWPSVRDARATVSQTQRSS